MTSQILLLILICSAVALLYSFILIRRIKRYNAGNQKMQELSGYIRTGAMSFLFKQYKVLICVITALTVLIGFSNGDGYKWQLSLAFILGSLLSGLSGFIGMRIATGANSRTTQAAADGGATKSLKVAFSGGIAIGMCVVGLGLIGITSLFILFTQILKLDYSFSTQLISGYSLGASLIALFARVAGGIYTKAADVGADLVGKIEAGIPEDDYRNPAVIADNVGDNVGDVAGLGADLLESYVAAIITSISLGIIYFGMDGALFSLSLVGIGIICSILGSLLVKTGKKISPHTALNIGTYAATAFLIITALPLSYYFFYNRTSLVDASTTLKGYEPFVAVIIGLISGIAIGSITEYYTSDSYRHVKLIAEQSKTGHATNIIAGFSIGMQSTGLPIIVLCICILLSYQVAGTFGIALAAIGMLSNTGIVVGIDAYGPISDNAGGIAEMAQLDPSVRKITDQLDSIGNTTAAIGKGFAVGSATLASLSLFITFAEKAGLSVINIIEPVVIIGVLVGGMLPFIFSALTIKAVGRAANKMIEDVRDQFKNNPEIISGNSKPDYNRCIQISTMAAIKEMILPAILAVATPVLFGIVFGVIALAGLLVGSLISAVMLAIFMANSGGAWDNAKKFIEKGNQGGKQSIAHQSSVTGDTVGDPLKDTSGPSLNILIKLMSVISLVIIPLLLLINNGEGIISSIF